MKLTIYFDGSYWCGLIEYEGVEGDYRACKYLFGAEPKVSEVEEFIVNQMDHVIYLNDQKLKKSSNKISVKKEKKKNPKKMQREINRQKKKPILCTKAQQSMKEAQEQFKLIKRKNSKERKEQMKREQFLLKQEKKLQKKRGH
ncbi:YjdF family protein [Enterococcus sp. DIV0086]|uniref:YjdF family protein n=1 Tax=Enterococcus sp. DIV0086 TaxID=2774655 RepID=UPI003D2CC49D